MKICLNGSFVDFSLESLRMKFNSRHRLGLEWEREGSTHEETHKTRWKEEEKYGILSSRVNLISPVFTWGGWNWIHNPPLYPLYSSRHRSLNSQKNVMFEFSPYRVFSYGWLE